MAIQTTLTLTSNSPSRGDVRLVEGTLTGNRNRTVKISASPKPGAVFVGWEIDKYPIEYPESGIKVAALANTKESLCSQPNLMAQIPENTYKGDDDKLYKDIYGTTVLSDGFWGTSTSTYIEIRNGTVLSSGTCGGSGTGGGGGGPGDQTFQF